MSRVFELKTPKVHNNTRIIILPAPDDVGREVGVDILIIGAVQGTRESTFCPAKLQSG